jgi:hypothetical protein
MGGYVRKWDGWKGRSFLYCAALTAKARAHVLDSLITSRKGRGVMHIGRANDKLKSGNAAYPACLPCMEGFGANRFMTFVGSELPFGAALVLPLILRAFPTNCCPCASRPSFL